MVEIRNWSFQDLVDFLEDYGFSQGYSQKGCNGSHYYYNGRISGETRAVQAVFSKKERNCQSLKTMKMAIRHSGIPKDYFSEWKRKGVIHKEIIG